MLSRLTATPRARFFLACAVGGALAIVVFAYFLLEGRFDLFEPEFLSSFYDVQARSLLEGHWDVPARSLAWERFEIDGKYYTYFGPWPAFLRMPILALTHRLDGQLSRVSMLLAYGLLLGAAARLCWQARTLVRGNGPPTRATLLGAGGFVFLIGCGSTVLFLSGRTWVYHEALLWGLAWTLAAFSCFIAYVVDPTRRNLVLVSATATLAFLSRATVGSGPVLALGALLVVLVVGRILAARRGAVHASEAVAEPGPEPSWMRVLGIPGEAAARVRLWPLAIATAVPLALYAYVNYSKFRSLYGLPLEKQDIIVASDLGQRAFAANDGSITGLTYLPTNLLQYFRPDAIGFDRFFPWVTFSREPRVIGSPVFIDIDFSASITASSTLVLLLAVIGLIAIVRAPKPATAGSSAALLRVPVVLASVGAFVTLSIAYLQHRYEADFLPMFVIAGAAGLWYLARLLEGRPAWWRRTALAVVVVLGAWSCWATASLTFLHQRAYGPLVPQASLARLVDVGLTVHELLPGGAPSRVRHVRGLPLPEPDSRQSLLVVGDCGGLFYSTGRGWTPVELTPATGTYVLRVQFPAAPAGTREPLISAMDARGSSIVWVRYLEKSRVRIEYEWSDAPPNSAARTAPIPVTPGAPFDLRIRLDPAVGFFSIHHAGDELGIPYGFYGPVAEAAGVVGRQDAFPNEAPRFTGTIKVLPTPTPLCDRLARLEREDAAPTSSRA